MRACQRDSVSRCLRPPLLCCLVTLGYQDAQHGTEAPLSPTASDTEVLCWSVCTQVPSKASVHSYSAGPAPTCHSAVSAPVQVAFQPTPPHLLVYSHVVANLPSEAAVFKPIGNRGKGGRGRTPWCCDSGDGAATAACCVRTRSSFRRGAQGMSSLSQQAGRQKSSQCLLFWELSEVFLCLSQRTRRGIEMLERNRRKWKPKILERSWKEKTFVREHFSQKENKRY